MSLDDDADDDVGGARPPLPPDDRLWRHPSEMGLQMQALELASDARGTGRPPTWTIVLVAGLAGAVLSSGLIAITGRLAPRVVERQVIEKVAVTPVVSSPTLRGDNGV